MARAEDRFTAQIACNPGATDPAVRREDAPASVASDGENPAPSISDDGALLTPFTPDAGDNPAPATPDDVVPFHP